MHTGINVEEVKRKIVWFLNERGPSLPVHVAKTTGLSIVFTSAILSEMVGEEKVKMSNMRIGSSPLYLTPGQEPKLENFIDNFKGVEKEALLKLKQNKILKDEEQGPVIRVALSSIKDFAVPLKVDDKIIWKYFTVSNDEVKEILSEEEKKAEVKPKETAGVLGKEERPEKTIEKEIKKKLKPKETKPSAEEKPIIKIKKPKKEKQVPTKFLEEVKEFLLKKDIEFVQEILVDKKEVIAKIRINSDFDKMNFLMVAKDKKKVSEADLILAYQKALNEKMPCLFMFKGDISKKIQLFLEPYKNLLKIIKIH